MSKNRTNYKKKKKKKKLDTTRNDLNNFAKYIFTQPLKHGQDEMQDQF